MRGLALKIFLSFWLIFAALIASFAVLRSRSPSIRVADHVQQYGLIAAALLESRGAPACADFAAAVAERTRVALVLLDARGALACHAPAVDADRFAPPAPGGPAARSPAADALSADVRGPSGAGYTAVGAPLPGFDTALPVRPPFPFGAVGITILVSGAVCFSMARYLARPLRQMRDVSYRLAAGDLQARVGPRVAARRDEIGDLVRDFDVMASRLEALVRAEHQLLSDISHELRSPLARLNVALELAKRKAGPEAQSDLERLEEEAERMNDLIGRLLALARAESVDAAATREPVDLADIVRHVTTDADYEAQRQQKSVALHIVATPPVNGDPQLIASALDNVVRNAVRYTPERTIVDVTLDGAGADAVITVRDRGPGVPATEIDRIFRPFHRVEPGRHRESGGVGLGLAIAQRAVAVHGGRIAAENAEDGGLCVTIRLPVGEISQAADPR